MTQIGQRLYAAEQVRELDRRAIQQGTPGYVLMQRAARRCWEEIRSRWPGAHRFVVVCGSGNNGGDGFEIARLAQDAGRAVSVMLVGDPPKDGDAATAYAEWLKVGSCTGMDARRLAGVEVIVDALFGIGLSRPVAGDALAAVQDINAARQAGARVLAVDVPSGLSADNGAILGEAVRADVTVSFIGRKLGLHTGAGPECAGKIVFDALGVDDAVHEGLAPLAQCLEERDLRRYLPQRARGAHKGSNGHVLVVGGGQGMAGAALLAGRGALRAGAGLVTIATR
ncbi:MAG TPA: NAD(P)H-hydrate epimerase, partial [Candidatus Binatia bacterium]|nr:NAD(P)H-hydrate epimerase [Candidatus Binatia bacterium]